MVLARLLEPDDFGLIAMVIVLVALSQGLVNSGLDLSLIQKKEVSEAHYGTVFSFNLMVGFFLFLITFGLADVVSDFYDKPALLSLTRATSVLFLIHAFGQVKTAWLQKNLKYNILSQANIVSLIIGGITAIAMALLQYGVWALLAQYIAAGITYNIYLALADPWQPRWFVFKKKAFLDLWGYGIRMFLSNFINTAVSQLDSMFIGRMFNQTLLGFFYRAKNLNNYIITLTSSSFASVFFPVLSSIQDDKEQYERVFLKALHLICFISFVLTGWLITVSNDLIVLLFTDKWIGSADYFRILLLGAWVYPVSSILLMTISSRGKSATFLLLEIIKQVLVIATLVFGLLNGIDFYLFAFVAVVYLSIFLNAWFASRELSVSFIRILKIIAGYFFISLPAVFLPLFSDYQGLVEANHWIRFLIFSAGFMSVSLIIYAATRSKGMAYFIEETGSLHRKFRTSNKP